MNEYKHVADVGTMIDAQTPAEWLLAVYDEWLHALINEDDIHNRCMFEVINDHGPNYPKLNEEEDPDCAPRAPRNTTGECRYWSGAASWPNAIGYMRINLDPGYADSQEYRDLVASDMAQQTT